MKYNPDKKSTSLTKRFYRDLFADTKELYRLAEKGIKGAVKRIKDPYANGDSNEPVDFPAFYQVEGVHFLLKNKRVLIADEMGVGKTAQAVLGKLEIQRRTRRKVRALVITPNSVKSHWRGEIRAYCEDGRAGKVAVLDDYTEQALEDIKDADFTIANYDLFSMADDRTKEAIASQDFDYVVLDEVQNIKNPVAVRSGHIKEIADRAEYLCLLSGTPIPNRLDDIYMLIALLEKDTYKDIRDENGKIIRPAAQAVREAHWKNPRISRVILERRRLKRNAEDVMQLPDLSDQVYPLELNDEQKGLYEDILNNAELEGAYKLQQLRYALLDPALVNPAVIIDDSLRLKQRSIESSKYKALDKIITEAVSSGEKVVVCSPIFQRGVTKNLARRCRAILRGLNRDYRALVMDGTNEDVRESIRQQFQKDPTKVVLIATGVAGEGISLTSASTAVFLENPYTPGERRQMVKRLHRRGQKNSVKTLTLSAPGTVDEGVIELLRQKGEAIEFIEKGAPLKEEHKELFMRAAHRTSPIRRYLYTPQQRINRWSYEMCSLGAERIYKNLKRKNFTIAKAYAENYVRDWETSVSANTARLCKQLIGQLESGGKLDRKIDIGSGPEVLSRVLGEKTTNIELNEYHFKQGFAQSRNSNVAAAMHQLPLKSGQYDLAVCANAVNDTSFVRGSDEITERELAIREANRILKNGGYYIVTLPRGTVNKESTDRLQHSLEHSGFEIVPQLTGFARSMDPSIGFNVYAAVARKVGEPAADPLERRYLQLASDDRTVRPKAKKTSFGSQRKRGICTEFVFE